MCGGQLIFGLDIKMVTVNCQSVPVSGLRIQSLTHQELKNRFYIYKKIPVPNTTKEISEVFVKKASLS